MQDKTALPFAKNLINQKANYLLNEATCYQLPWYSLQWLHNVYIKNINFTQLLHYFISSVVQEKEQKFSKLEKVFVSDYIWFTIV